MYRLHICIYAPYHRLVLRACSFARSQNNDAYELARLSEAFRKFLSFSCNEYYLPLPIGSLLPVAKCTCVRPRACVFVNACVRACMGEWVSVHGCACVGNDVVSLYPFASGLPFTSKGSCNLRDNEIDKGQ
jgi:hypothetical protein